jgi:hypothetical protein
MSPQHSGRNGEANAAARALRTRRTIFGKMLGTLSLLPPLFVGYEKAPVVGVLFRLLVDASPVAVLKVVGIPVVVARTSTFDV